MKYVSFRIDTQSIKNHEVVNGWFVRGQRDTDYNWPMLHEAASFDDAKKFIDGIRDDNQPVYGPDGYAIKM